MDVTSKELLAALKTIAGSCKPDKAYEILANVRIEARGDKLTVTGFNLDCQVEITIACHGTIGPLLVRREALAAWLEKAKTDGDVSLEQEGDSVLALRLGRASARLPLAPLENWGAIAEEEMAHAFIVPSTGFREAIRSALMSVFEDVSRPWLSGVRIETGSVSDPADCSRLSLCGTNGVMLVAVDIPVTGSSSRTGIIVSKDLCEAISKLFPQSASLVVSWGERLVKVEAEGRRLLGRLVEGTYPEKWRSLDARRHEPNISYDKSALSTALATVASLAPRRGERLSLAVDLTFSAQTTTISAKHDHSAMGASDECAHSIMSEPECKTITVAANQIMKIIDALGAETVQLSVSEAIGQPIVVTGAAMADRFALSVPIRSAGIAHA
jgi:DNA polymerase-3 subunit beta